MWVVYGFCVMVGGEDGSQRAQNRSSFTHMMATWSVYRFKLHTTFGSLESGSTRSPILDAMGMYYNTLERTVASIAIYFAYISLYWSVAQFDPLL